MIHLEQFFSLGFWCDFLTQWTHSEPSWLHEYVCLYRPKLQSILPWNMFGPYQNKMACIIILGHRIWSFVHHFEKVFWEWFFHVAGLERWEGNQIIVNVNAIHFGKLSYSWSVPATVIPGRADTQLLPWQTFDMATHGGSWRSLGPWDSYWTFGRETPFATYPLVIHFKDS